MKKNKGIAMRNATRKRKRKKVVCSKKSQVGLCRFIKFKYRKWRPAGGKFLPDGFGNGFGLQIENKVYMEDGSYKFVNGKNFHIKEKYTDIPKGAPANLIEKYHDFKKKQKSDK